MTFQRELILLGARDSPLPCHELAMLSHGQARARLGIARRLWAQFTQAEAFEGAQLAHEIPGLTKFDQASRKTRLQHQWHIAGGIRACSDAGVDLATRDAAGQQHRCLQRRAAGHLQRRPRGLRRQAGAQNGFASQIPVARMGGDSARDDIVNLAPCQIVLINQRLQGIGKHVQIAQLRVSSVGATEGNPGSADDGDTSK